MRHRHPGFGFHSFLKARATQGIVRVLVLTMVATTAPTDGWSRATRGAGGEASRREPGTDPEALSLAVAARLLVVDPTGACGGEPRCFRTIQAAVTESRGGDVVRVRPGTYRETVNVRVKNTGFDGGEGDRLVIEADPEAPPESVIVQGRSRLCNGGSAFRVRGSRRVTIRGFLIESAGGYGVALLGGRSRNESIVVERNHFLGNGLRACGGGISVARGNSATLIANNLIQDSGRNGIRFLDSTGGPHWVVENTILRNGWNGIAITRGVAIGMVNNLVVGNGRAPGRTGGRVGVLRERGGSPSPAGATMIGNLVCGNRDGELSGPLLGDGADRDNGTPSGSEGPGVRAEGAACGDFTSLFTRSAGGDGQDGTRDDDYRLASGSSATDRGSDLATIPALAPYLPVLGADLRAQDVRPADGDGDGDAAFDVGAHERPAGGTNPTATPTPSPTGTGIALPTPTATGTGTPSPTANPTGTGVPTATARPTATATTTPTPTRTPSSAGPPIAVDDDYAVRPGDTLVVPPPGVLGNDSDPDHDPLSARLLTPPALGSLPEFGSAGGFTYVAPATFAQPSLDPRVLWRTYHGISGFAQVADFDHDGHPDVVYPEFGALRALDGKTGARLWDFDASDTTDVDVSGCSLFTNSSVAIGDLTDGGDVSVVKPISCESSGADRFVAIDGSQITAGRVRATWASDRLTQPHPEALANAADPAPPVPPIRPYFDAAAFTEPTLARLETGGGVKVLARRMIGPFLGSYLARDASGGVVTRWAGCRSVTGLPADEGRQCRVTWILDGTDGSVDAVLTAPNPSGEQTIGSWRPWRQNAPIAADLDGDGTVEIVSGSDVFRRTAGGWELAWQTQFEPSSVAVADLDGDGKAEVIHHQPGNWSSRSPADAGILIYSHDGTLIRRIPPKELGESSFGFVSIADADGDGSPDILYTVDGILYVYRSDGRLLWLFMIPDRPEPLGGLVPGPVALFGRSGETAPQVYDLDLDGRPEVLLNAASRLFIFDGRTGRELWSIDTEGGSFGARSLALADFDADGHVDILATGANRWNCSGGGGPVPCLGNTLVVSGLGGLWAPGPKVFHQIHYRANAVDDAAQILFAPANRRDFRRAAQQGAVVDPRLRAGASFTYEAADGSGATDSATVFVKISPENSPPSIVSLPPTAFLSVAPYTRPTYQITATDPDPGDTIHYELVSTTHPFGAGPGQGVQVDPTTGLVDFYVGPCGSFGGPCEFGRDVVVVVAAIDSLGARDEQSFLLTITAQRATVPNVVGQILQPAIDTLLGAGLRARVLLETFDASPAGTVLTQNPVAGTANVPVGASVELTLSKGPQATPTPASTPTSTPDPNATPTPVPTNGAALASIVVEPTAAVVLTGETRSFVATGILVDGTSTDLTAQVSWQSSSPASATIDGGGVASAVAAGGSTVSATLGGVSGTAALSVVARVAGDGEPPIAEIASPTSNALVTEPIDVVGTASDTNFLSYELAIAPAGESSFAVVAAGTSPVVSGVLGRLDPTLLLNEPLELRLTVRDRAGNEAVARVTVQVARERKVGLFTLTFQDLNVALSGLPITISRTYDSRDKGRGEFGTGWRMGLQTLRLRTNRVLGTGWTTQTSGINVQLVALDQHTVTITLPDGKVEIFDLQLFPTANVGSLDFTNVIGFAPRPDTLGTLEGLDNPGLLIVPGGTEVELWDDTTLQTYSPRRFRYTDRVGNRFVVDRIAGVLSVQDRDGNTLDFGPGGITHSSGRSVGIVRDALGRITAINDPAGATQTYAYDGNGDLRFHTDADGRVTEFKYDRHHGLLQVITPDGKLGVRNEYDDEGRLVASVDGEGHRVEYLRTPGVSQEIVRDRLGHQSVIEYDAVGNVVAKTDALGARTQFTFDARGNQLSETDPVGRTATKTYDAADRVLTATDFDGNTTTYVYGAGGRLASTSDPEGHVTTYSYDGRGRLASITLPDGGVTTNTYDGAGNLVAVTDPLGHTTTSTYDGFGNRLTQTDPLGVVTTFTYDALGRRTSEQRQRTLPGGASQTLTRGSEYDGFGHVVRSIDALGNASVTTYDGAGHVATILAPDGGLTVQTYDDAGNLIRSTYPDGSAEQWTFDAERRGTSSTDRDGRTTSYAHDAVGRLIRTTYPDGSTEEIAYDPAGRISAKTDPRGNVTTYAYAANQQTVTDALGHVTVHHFDSQRRTVWTTDANGNTTTYAYDHRGNPTVTTYPDGSTRTEAYDLAGRRVSSTDQAGRTTTFAWNARNELVSATDPGGATTAYAYDEVGNRIAETSPTGAITRFEYDGNGRLTSRVRPLGQRDVAVYDAVSRVTSFTDMNGETTTTAYDASGNPTARHLPGGGVVPFAFTAGGLRLQAGGDTYSYDLRGRVAAEVKGSGETLAFAYDASGNRTAVTSSAGTTAYTYDALDRLATVSDASGTTSYSYDAVGNLDSITYPSGLVTTHAYDSLNRLVAMETVDAGSSLLARYEYTLGAAGNRVRVVESGSATTGRAVNYEYDAVSRLVREVIDEPGTSLDREILYTYDAAGNRLSRVDVMGAIRAETTYSYDLNDRLLAETTSVANNGVPSGSVSLTYSYDANGNLLSRSNGTETDTYTFDSSNRLVHAELEIGGVSSVDNAYDADGLRTSSTTGGQTTEYVTDKGFENAQVLLEKRGPSTVAYTLGLTRIARRVDGFPASFFLSDGQASTRHLTSAAGAVTDAYTFDAFGRLLGSSGASDNDFLYAGEQLDPNVGFYYLRARWYDQNAGRFVSPDPKPGSVYDPPSLHRYLYVRSSPVDLRDPSGLENMISVSQAAAIAGTLAAIAGIGTYAYTHNGGLAIAVSAGVFAAAFVAVYGVAATYAWGLNLFYEWTAVIAPGAYMTQQYLQRAGNAILAQGQAIIYQANQALIQQYGNAVQGINNVNQFLLRPETAGFIRHVNGLLGNPVGRRIVCAAISAARAFSQIEGGPDAGGPGPYDRAQAAMIASALIFMAGARGLVCGDSGPP